MIPLILSLLGNKVFLTIGAGVLGAIFVYFKGYSSGKQGQQELIRDSKDKITDEVRKTEAVNQQISTQREQDEKAINNSTNANDLIELWNSLDRKDSDPKA